MYGTRTPQVNDHYKLPRFPSSVKMIVIDTNALLAFGKHKTMYNFIAFGMEENKNFKLQLNFKLNGTFFFF
jgi:hypothetical protein